MNINLLRQTIDQLFSKRSSMMTLMQEIGEHFFPERAEFTVRHDFTDEYAGNLTTSYPVLVRRELGNQVGAMMRPTAKQWFHMAVGDPGDKTDLEAKRWLEHQTKVQKNAMYDRKSLFTRAMKQGDHDFVAFGQTPISIRLNRNANGLIYQCWHLRDVVWMENEEGEVCLIARKWKPYAVDVKRLFGAKAHPSLANEAEREPFAEVECLHVIIKSEMFDAPANGKPYFSIYLDCKHQDHVMEQVPVWNREYALPRWWLPGGSQYALSPATITALPDARLIQSMAYTLLTAGEKIVDPPLVGTEGVVKSDVAIYAGGMTWIDRDYDERTGDALRQMPIDAKGMPLGLEMMQDTRNLITQAFYLNKLTLPVHSDPQMTAYEFGQRVQQYIRDALPLFEPMEYEYNGQICEMTFDIMMRAGGFGSPFNIPRSLQGKDVHFRFESPLHDAIEQQKGQKLVEAQELVAKSLALDSTAVAVLDARTALREALEGIQTPAAWIRSESEVDAMVAEQQEAQTAAQVLDLMQKGADVGASAKEAGMV